MACSLTNWSDRLGRAKRDSQRVASNKFIQSGCEIGPSNAAPPVDDLDPAAQLNFPLKYVHRLTEELKIVQLRFTKCKVI